MDERQKLDEIIASAEQKIEDEIGGLIGASFSLKQTRKKIASWRDLLEPLSGRQILTDFEISGDITGTAHTLITVRDAIRLGGTLLMLPSSELDELLESESYEEETEDSYGEIGNIIAGIYTNLFEEMHEPPCRFARAGQRVVTLPITGVEGELPGAEDQFYQIDSDITLDGKELGTLIQLFPALFPGREEDDENLESRNQTDQGDINKIEPDAADESFTKPDSKEFASQESETETSETDGLTTSQVNAETPGSDVDKRKNEIDSLLEICRVSIQQEVADAVGVDVTFSEMNNNVVSKEQFFLQETSGKQVAATMEASGDFEGSCYLYLGIKHAIRIGGTLLMLPAGELERAVSEKTFSPDVHDAYDEVVSTISRIYTDVFIENSGKNVNFIKTDIDQVIPMKVDIGSSEPIVNQTYYLNSLKIGLDGEDCGHLQILFPTEMLGMESLQPAGSGHLSEEQAENLQKPISFVNSSGHDGDTETGSDAYRVKNNTGKVLIISDADPEAESIHKILDSQGVDADQLNFRDNVNDYLPGTYQAVLLVMRDVDEQSLGLAIKISTSCSLPLIAAGYSWTRSKVLKAVKYGVSDIILAPATEEEVSRKITCLITSLAA